MARRAAAGTPVGARGAKRARAGRGRSGVAVEVGARPATARGAIEVKVEAGAGEYTGPFPSARRPPARDFYAAVRYLAGRHGDPECWIGKGDGCSRFERPRVLDSLVRTILSQNTTDITSQRAFASLNRAYGGDYAKVRDAPTADVATAIRVGGLADIKAGRIQTILRTLTEEQHGVDAPAEAQPSLEHLRDMDDEAIKDSLTRFKGVGPKTVSCVLMFALNRQDFPVDTHVWQLARTLGWVPKSATREQTYEHLNRVVPNELKHDLHVLMVEHGKRDGHGAAGIRGAIAKAAAGGDSKSVVVKSEQGSPPAAVKIEVDAPPLGEAPASPGVKVKQERFD